MSDLKQVTILLPRAEAARVEELGPSHVIAAGLAAMSAPAKKTASRRAPRARAASTSTSSRRTSRAAKPKTMEN